MHAHEESFTVQVPLGKGKEWLSWKDSERPGLVEPWAQALPALPITRNSISLLVTPVHEPGLARH